MKFLTMLFISLLLSGNVIADTQNTQTQAPAFEEGDDYANVRLKMIEAGWEPYHAEDADQCGQSDDRCQGRPEMEACAGSGLGNCRFLWRKDSEQIAICTVDAGPAVYDGRCD